MENSGGIQASLAGRYALALFELARDNGQIDSVGQSLSTVKTALAEVADFRALVSSPLVSRDAAEKAVAGVAASLKLDPLTTKFLGVLANNRRLGKLSGMIRAFETLVSAHKGETRAEVTSAFPLTSEQTDALAQQLRTRVGSDVLLETRVDPAIMGGLVVKIGSQMIDSSIRTRLNTLAMAMKG
ncbi:MAG TPA: F0F1 ATP synthase subunit delta [Sphingobium sp.]|uniref:F0F1 ATP synthase subunit delta n=1 Tax=Sphingobium sp. TaxID=1912891 RepID=UPI002ED5DEE1